MPAQLDSHGETAQEPPESIPMHDPDTSPMMDTAKSKSEASRNAAEESESMTIPQIDGWTVAREIASWLPDQACHVCIEAN